MGFLCDGDLHAIDPFVSQRFFWLHERAGDGLPSTSTDRKSRSRSVAAVARLSRKALASASPSRSFWVRRTPVGPQYGYDRRSGDGGTALGLHGETAWIGNAAKLCDVSVHLAREISPDNQVQGSHRRETRRRPASASRKSKTQVRLQGCPKKRSHTMKEVRVPEANRSSRAG